MLTGTQGDELGLGVIIPSGNTILERDFHRAPFAGVQFYFTRIQGSQDSAEQLAGMRSLAEGAAALLSHSGRCSAIGFGCTSGSFLRGADPEAELQRAMVQASGLPTVTTSGAVVSALRHLGIKRPMVFTPYQYWLSQLSVDFLEDKGYEVSGHRWGFDITIGHPTDQYQEINDWVASEVVDDADGIFISCTNFTWFNGIAALEQRLNRPVVTSNSALLWSLLRIAGNSATASISQLFS